jgi:4-carboxymuconolactone decarboxylase
MNKRLEDGWALFNTLHGKHTGDAMIASLKDICPDYGDLTAEFGFGHIFSRQGLDIKTRELQAIALCAALGDMPGQLRAHLEAALMCGVTKEACVETILQTCLYAGFARVTNALMIAKEVLL